VGPWHDRPGVALVAVTTETVLAPTAVRDCVARVRAAGYRELVTGPLTATAAAPFLDAGFTLREQLHLLVHSLGATLPPDRTARLRRARRGDWTAVVELDTRAFPPAWRLGSSGLRDALRATPASRFRVGQREDDPIPVAYAVTGRSGRQGYLQRLAVHPAVRGRGLGRALVADALGWFRRGGGHRCLVNTQVENHEAVALYEACGFRRLPSGLAVLGCAL
jgi:ribosomal protein S18 acetylase RimI-like enzyme